MVLSGLELNELINLMMYLSESSTAQHCNLVTANDGTPFFGPRIAIKGLWSVTSVNFHTVTGETS